MNYFIKNMKQEVFKSMTVLIQDSLKANRRQS